MSNTFEVLSTAPWQSDDKIMTRDPFLKFATFDGTEFVGGLINHEQLLPSLGYKVYYSGALGAVLEQKGINQFPVENVALAKGWNWIGHAPLHIYSIAEIVPVNGSPGFSADDQIKTRAGTNLGTSTFSGTSWQGDLGQLAPGIGYEVKVSQAMTFNYGDASDHSD